MLITVFVFLGIEGASVYSRMARKREDVGRAMVIGFLSVLCVFALVTLVSYGVMPQDELAGVSQPSMAAVLESIVGPWGSIFIRVGVIVSVLGAYLAWTLMAAEVLYIPATTDDMPRFLARTNRHGAPMPALVIAAQVVSDSCNAAESAPRSASFVCLSMSTLEVGMASPAPSPAQNQAG